MDSKLFRSILLIISFSVFLVAIILNFDKIGAGFVFLKGILMPVIIGFILAFILNRPFLFFKKIYMKLCGKIFRKSKRDHELLCRALAIVTVYLITIAVLTVILGLVIPQFADSVQSLRKNIEIYQKNIAAFLLDTETRLGLDFSISDKIVESIPNIFNEIPNYIGGLIPKVFATAGSVASSISNWILGFAMSVYMLASKNRLLKQIRHFAYAYFPLKIADSTSKLTGLASDIFGRFISGQITDAFIVGLLCFIGMTIMRLDYAFLISVIIAATNIIPVFGPFIGAIPSAFLLLMIEPFQALCFIIFIIILQQIDGNLICPRIVGDSVGLPAWWVLFAILIGGGAFGIIGMIIGVPTFCLIYRLLGEKIRKNEHSKTD